MTIEQSLRRRATLARSLGILWLALAALLVVCSFASLPHMVASAINSVDKMQLLPSSSASPNGEAMVGKGVFTNVQFLAIVTLVLGLCTVSLACYFLGRAGCVEIELAARYGGLADTLCLAGKDFDQLERAAAVMVPKSRFLFAPEILSAKDLKSVADALKPLRDLGDQSGSDARS